MSTSVPSPKLSTGELIPKYEHMCTFTKMSTSALITKVEHQKKKLVLCEHKIVCCIQKCGILICVHGFYTKNVSFPFPWLASPSFNIHIS